MTESERKPTLWRYVKEAFMFRWNLLFLGGATALAAISGHADIALPLVAASEMAYLAGLTAMPKFRAAIDAKVWNETRPQATQAQTQSATEAFNSMVDGLLPKKRSRFAALRTRCVDMAKLAAGVRGRTGSGRPKHSSAALNRLLWSFVRLLYSQQALETFMEATDEDEIKSDIKRFKEKLEVAKANEDERQVRSLTDSLATAELRLDNYQKAESNAEYIDLELDRIEGKIQALTEMSISHEDPDYLSSQVDSVADSMVATEATIRELNHITGVTDDMQEPPPILDEEFEIA